MASPSSYSPGIALCDCFLLPYVKRQLEGKQFQNAEDARTFFEGIILDIPQSTWSGAIDSWFQRTVKCVKAKVGGLRKTGVDRVFVSAPEKKTKPDCKTK